MKAFSIVTALLIVLGMTSCVKQSDDITITSNPKLIVECYLNPTDSDIIATVNENRPITGEGSGSRSTTNPVLDATVLLSDGSKEVKLTNTKNNIYKIQAKDFMLIAGRTYTLKVTAPGLPATEATCTIPSMLHALDAKDSELSYEQADASTYNVYRKRSLSWTNAESSQTNYYMVGSGEGTPVKIKTLKGDSTCVRLKNAAVIAFLDNSKATNQHVTTGTLSFLLGKTTSKTDQKITSAAPMYSFVYHVDHNYYEFFRTVKLQREVGDNPFAEAVPVYSNIQNGLGVFGAYVVQVKSL